MRLIAGGSTHREFFDKLYAGNGDPWNYEKSTYERRKYRATIDAIPRRRYASALEVGCSIGVLTRLLAGRCETLLATDVAEEALVDARRRCQDLPNVRFQRAAVPAEWPEGTFDLIVVSEVLYFLGAEAIVDTADRITSSLRLRGVVLLVDFLGRTGTPCNGDCAAENFINRSCRIGRAGALVVAMQRRQAQYRLDLLTRAR